MFYEYVCHNTYAHPYQHGYHYWLARKPIAECNTPAPCPLCGLYGTRMFSVPTINKNEMVADGFRRTNEPPDELKPDQWNENVRHDMDHYKVVSTPSTTRIAGTIDRPNKKKDLYKE